MAVAVIKANRCTCDYEDCGHTWISDTVPPRCSKCKRRNWNAGGLDRATLKRAAFILEGRASRKRAVR
jgi:hypothetical protein